MNKRADLFQQPANNNHPGKIVRVENEHETDPVVFVVRETYDYDKFKAMPGNRSVIEAHVRRLQSSFEKKYLVRVVIVNENFEKIDGQHGIEAARRTGNPVRYVVVPGYGLEEVQAYNTHVEKWTKQQFLESFADLGVEAYVTMRQFMEDYPVFNIRSAEVLLTLQYQGANYYRASGEDGKRVRFKVFEDGEMEIANLEKSRKIADHIMEFLPYYKGANRLAFVRAIIRIFEVPGYKPERMIRKVKLQQRKMADCNRTEEYKDLLEEIYNYHATKKISFRYA